MARIGFIGLGNMGGPMAANLVKAGHSVTGFDLMPDNMARAISGGVAAAPDIAGAVAGAEIVVTMLPAGAHVRQVYTGPGGILASAAKGTLLIDSSTI
ncbi:MAG: NAD(P)-binding domain-containing protein, partial [Alphaproteobacteria bacterium]|nr:NAD(P)-binding domain-containing protein [Alphaproteobacteria bacterium]